MKKGRAATMTNDYKRHGTTTLFAALNMLDGTRHRHREFRWFLKLIDKTTPTHLDLHLIVDNYSTHKTAEVKRWLKSHTRFNVHFTPTSASWLKHVPYALAGVPDEVGTRRLRSF